MSDLYLKKSDVMAVMAWNHYAQQVLNGLPVRHIDDTPVAKPEMVDAIDRAELLKWFTNWAYISQVIRDMPTITVADKGEPVKLESGRLYRTRGGKKAFVAYIENPSSEKEYPVWGSTIDEPHCGWTLDGKYTSDVKSDHDLISLWDEPTPEPKEPSLESMIDAMVMTPEWDALMRRIVRELEGR